MIIENEKLDFKTLFPKQENNKPKYFLIDAKGKTLGRLATEVSKLLSAKEISYFTPGIDQGNSVIILNANGIVVSGKKEEQKLYYRNSQRPGSLKKENFKKLKNRIPSRILEKAIWGMLPKGILGKKYFKRLFIYPTNVIPSIKVEKIQKKLKPILKLKSNFSHNWIKLDI